MTNEWFERLLASGSCLVETLLEQATEDVGDEKKYGSPIEYALAVALRTMAQVRHREIMFTPMFSLNGVAARSLLDGAIESGATILAMIFPQVQIGEYRVDFLTLHRSGTGGVVVECDGHEFHEKTKKQAARDKARDRVLQARGYHVLRFTGSEIWKDPFACADEVISVVHGAALDAEFAQYMAGQQAKPSQRNAYAEARGRGIEDEMPF